MNAPLSGTSLMSGADYRESLHLCKPTVFVDGRRVDSVADEAAFRPGINAIALTYDYALGSEHAPMMTAVRHTSGKRVNRLSHINTSAGDLLNKLEAVRLVCQETGCAQRYLTHDARRATGVAASVYGKADEHCEVFMPAPVFSNIGKLLLATKIHDMHRIAHYVSGGLIVTLPGPDEDHSPETAARLSDVLRANPAVPYEQHIETARLIEDLTAGYQGGWYSVISLHGGGSPAAAPHDPARAITRNRQPGKCCDTGCTTPGQAVMIDLPVSRRA